MWGPIDASFLIEGIPRTSRLPSERPSHHPGWRHLGTEDDEGGNSDRAVSRRNRWPC